MELGLFVLLGVLTLIALASLLVTIFCAVAASIAPVLAGLADQVRRYRWRNWHPPTDWVPDLDSLDTLDSPDTAADRSPHASGVALVSNRQLGTNVELLTAQLPSTGEKALSTVTALHATLAPQARLELPEDSRDEVAVMVLSGVGTVGSRRRVRAGDLALVEPGEPVSVVAGDDHGSRALEVLVLGGVPSRPPSTGREPAPVAVEHVDDCPRPHRPSATGPIAKPPPSRAPKPPPVAKPALGPARAARTRRRPAAV